MGELHAREMVARVGNLRQSKIQSNMPVAYIRVGMGRLNATEIIARAWILTQTKDYIQYAGGLDEGRSGRAKC